MDRPQFVKSPSEAIEDFAVVPYQYLSESPPKSPLLLFDFPLGSIISIGGHDLPGELFDYFNPLLVGTTTSKWIQFHGPKDFPCLNLITKRPLELITRMPIFYPPQYLINYSTGTCIRSIGPHQVLQRLTLEPIPIPIISVDDLFYDEEEEDDEEIIDDMFGDL